MANNTNKYVVRVGAAYLGAMNLDQGLRPVNRPFAYEFDLRRHAEFHAEAYARQAQPDCEVEVVEL